MIFLDLFLMFFRLGLFAFGGGYVMVPLLQSEVISRGLLDIYEFVSLIGLAQMTPGPLGINSAAYIGYELAGAIGAIVSVVGVIAPSFIIIIFICHFFKKFYEQGLTQSILGGIRPVTIGLIASAGVSIFMMLMPLEASNDIIAKAAIILVALVLTLTNKINSIWIVIISAVLGILLY